VGQSIDLLDGYYLVIGYDKEQKSKVQLQRNKRGLMQNKSAVETGVWPGLWSRVQWTMS